MTDHLDEERLQALLEGRLDPEQEAALARHLAEEGECRACEEFLGGLDESVEGQLFSVLERSLRARDLPAEANRRILETVASKRPQISRAILLPAAGFAFVVLVVLAAVFWFSAEEGEGARIKGDPAGGVRVELSLGLVEAGRDGAVEVRRVASGSVVSLKSRLVFGVNTDAPCYLYLVRVGPDGLEVLLPDYFGEPLRHPGGSYTPMAGSQPAAYDLEGNAGTQHFAAVCSKGPLASPKDLQPLADRLWGAGDRLDVVSYDVVTLQVSGEDRAK
jgi:hypothetical protein